MKNTSTTLETYLNRVFKILMIILPMSALFAGILFSFLKGIGYYKNTSWILLSIFDATNVIYCFVGAILSIKSTDKEGEVRHKVVFAGKIIIAFIEVIQWNFISYMVPSSDYWAYFGFFILLVLFFLDHKYTLITIGLILTSTFISWAIQPALLPIRDDLFVPNVALRVTLMVLVSFCLWFLTFLLEKFLVKQLESIADYDVLTLLKNRRTLDFSLKKAIKEYERTQKPFSVLMCDIDDFKKVNDTLGHDFGDKVLQNIARIIMYDVKDQGSVFRFGGEEMFAILFMDENEAKELAESIRIDVSNCVTSSDGNDVKITMTFGIATYKDNMDGEDLIKVADANLYYGKSHGKNRVVV